MFAQIRKQLELIRFSHTVFAMPFALLAAVMAWHAQPPLPVSWLQWLAIGVCMVSARSAAMAFNRIADRKIDAQNPRTASRHLPAGDVTLQSVCLFTLVASIIFVASTSLFLPENPLPILFSIPLLLFLFGYSYAKRFTTLAHFWLGAALMLAPISAWIALRGPILMISPGDILPAVVLGGAVMFWVAGFDVIYALPGCRVRCAGGTSQYPQSLWRSHGTTVRNVVPCGYGGVASGVTAGVPLGMDLRVRGGGYRRITRLRTFSYSAGRFRPREYCLF